MNNQYSILIVEDELITANGISDLLTEEGFIVSGIAADASYALEIFEDADSRPEIVLCDINIKGDMNGIELAKQLKNKYGSKIIFLTAYDDNNTLYEAFGAEPTMYIVKPFSDKQLLTAVHMAFYSILKEENTNSTKIELLLTKREREIAELVMQGYTSRQIASQLYISLQTVKTHRKSMLQNNNLHSFSRLIYLMKQ